MSRRLIGLVVFSAAVFWAFIPLLGQEQQKETDLRKFVSEKGIITFWTPDCERLRAAWRKSFLAELLADEEMKPFLENLKKANMSPSGFLDKICKREVQMELKDVLSVFKGGMLLQLSGLDLWFFGTNQSGSPFLFMLNSKDSKQTLEKFLTNTTDAIRRATPENDRPEKSQIDHNGVTIYGLGMEHGAFFSTFLDSIWALTFDLDGIKQVIDRFKAQGAATILDDKALNNALLASGLKGKEDYMFWFDFCNLVDKMNKPKPPPEIETFTKITSLLPNILLVGAPDGEGYKEAAVIGYPEALPQGLKETITAPEKLLVEPDQILILSLGSNGSLKTFIELVFNLAQQDAQRFGRGSPLDALAKEFEFDWQKDVFGQLSGTFQLYAVKPTGSGAWPEFLAVMELTDAEKLTALLEKIIDTAQKGVEKKGEGEEEEGLEEALKKFKGIKKHKLGDLTLFVFETERNGSDIPYTPAFGIVGKRFIFGTQPQVVRGAAKALKEPFEAGKFAELLKKAKGKTLFSYINLPQIVAYAYNTFIPMLRKKEAEDLEEMGIDLSLLPDVKPIIKHFSPITITSSVKDNFLVTEVTSERGFGSVGTAASALGYILLCVMSAESDPDARMLRQITSMERSVVNGLKVISGAQEMYKTKNGKYADNIDILIKNGLLNAWSVETETHDITILGATNDSWSAVANPKKDSILKRYYFIDQTGVVRMSESQKIGPDSPVFEPIKELPKQVEEKPKDRFEKTPEELVPKPVK